MTPDFDHFALYRLAIRLRYSMSPWQTFYRLYTDFKTLRDQKWWQKQRQQCV